MKRYLSALMVLVLLLSSIGVRDQAQADSHLIEVLDYHGNVGAVQTLLDSLAAANGWSVTHISPASFAALTEAQLRTYDVLFVVSGSAANNLCGTFQWGATPDYSGLLANPSIGAAAAHGRKVITGLDPDWHAIFQGSAAARTFLANAINWVGTGPLTGYVALSDGRNCSEWWTSPGSFLQAPLASPGVGVVYGDFTVASVIDAAHPVNQGLGSSIAFCCHHTRISGAVPGFTTIMVDPTTGYAATLVADVVTSAVTAHFFNDENGNGNQESGEPNLSGWIATLHQGSNCSGTILESGITDGLGNATFQDLLIGEYSIAETLEPSWTNITPICKDLNLTGPQSIIVSFGNALSDLTLVEAALPNPVSTGGTLTYWSLIKNSGVGVAHNVLFRGTLPSQPTFQLELPVPNGCTLAPVPGGTLVTCNIGSLGSQQEAMLSFSGKVQAPPGTGLLATAVADPENTLLEVHEDNNGASIFVVVGVPAKDNAIPGGLLNKLKKLLTDVDFERLLNALQFATDATACTVDVLAFIVSRGASGTTPEMAQHCGEAIAVILEIIDSYVP